MNKRIRELAEQAGYNPLSPSTFADELNEIFMRKFAELIVWECSGFVYNYPERYLTRGQAREICQSMEEHFGVNE